MLTRRNLYILLNLFLLFSCKREQPEYFSLAIYERDAGNWEKALDLFEKCYPENKKNGDFWLERGCTYRELGLWEKALADFDTALCSVLPPRIVLERAITRYKMEDYKEAHALLMPDINMSWENFILSPMHPLRKDFYYWNGLVNLRMEDYKEAWYNFEAAATLGHPEACIEYQKVARQLNWPEQVLISLEEFPGEVTFADGTTCFLTQYPDPLTRLEEYTFVHWENKQLPVDYINMKFRNYDGVYGDDYFYSGKESPYKEWHYRKTPFLLYALVKDFYRNPDNFMRNYCEVASRGKKIGLFGFRMDYFLDATNPYILGEKFTNPPSPYVLDVVLFHFRKGQEEVRFIMLPGFFVTEGGHVC
ncbi:MAG: tetratricopeptide repeat protein [Tannerellaceae bacterium]|nr:tetratricopeptide repeat protein [Tannerellaceae bacterium]